MKWYKAVKEFRVGTNTEDFIHFKEGAELGLDGPGTQVKMSTSIGDITFSMENLINLGYFEPITKSNEN